MCVFCLWCCCLSLLIWWLAVQNYVSVSITGSTVIKLGYLPYQMIYRQQQKFCKIVLICIRRRFNQNYCIQRDPGIVRDLHVVLMGFINSVFLFFLCHFSLSFIYQRPIIILYFLLPDLREGLNWVLYILYISAPHYSIFFIYSLICAYFPLFYAHPIQASSINEVRTLVHTSIWDLRNSISG